MQLYTINLNALLVNNTVYAVDYDNNIRKIDYNDYVKILKKYNAPINIDKLIPFDERRYLSIQEYVDDHPELYDLDNKRVLLLFSGGKDSVLSYLVLKYVGAEIIPIYLHLPFFEDLLLHESHDIFDELGVEVRMISDEVVIQHLYSRGMPTPWSRWCTGLKFRVVREVKESYDYDFIAEGVRAYESDARERRLKNKIVVGERKVRPILFFTNADAFSIVYRHGLLNPMYEYSPRTSCVLCPYSQGPLRIIRWRMYEEKLPGRARVFAEVVDDVADFREVLGGYYMVGRELKKQIISMRRELAKYEAVEDREVVDVWQEALTSIIDA